MVERPPKGRLTAPLINPEPEVMFDLAVFIGRFQPFHFGHLHVILIALLRAKFVLINVGSLDLARRPDHNPLTASERESMIRACLTPEQNARVVFRYCRDYGNMPLWTAAIRRNVKEVVEAKGFDDPNVTLIGHSKDRSSFYLRAFPEWDSIDVEPMPIDGCGNHTLSATPMRRAYFAEDGVLVDHWLNHEFPKFMPQGAIDWLKEFKTTDDYKDMVEEWAFHRKYDTLYDSEARRRGWWQFFVTVDNIVVCNGHVLLIQRKNRPGRNLWAFPGGFLELDEYIEQGSLRELHEETRIRVPESVLKGSIVTTKVFDNPHRSMRGRTITHATLYHIVPKAPKRHPKESAADYKVRLNEALKRPEVRAADDAKQAIWIPIDEFLQMQAVMFEDHFSMGEAMLALLPKED
jgi:bifunctional NMN adenylyltransferase/nudix hydrolase